MLRSGLIFFFWRGVMILGSRKEEEYEKRKKEMKDRVYVL